MKKPFLNIKIIHVPVILVIFLSSCKKEVPASVISSADVQDIPPIAQAGNDIILQLPLDTIHLDGSASVDVRGITSYEWTKISGPASFEIVNPSSAMTSVKKLVEGVYTLNLKVTNYSGLSSSDIVYVVVLPESPLPVPNKLDTTFHFAVSYSGSSYPVFGVRKDFYIPILSSIVNPHLQIFSQWNNNPWVEIFEYSPTKPLGQSYSRNKCTVTYAALIIGYSSVMIGVRITAEW